jgi:hypothetical protein
MLVKQEVRVKKKKKKNKFLLFFVKKKKKNRALVLGLLVIHRKVSSRIFQ